MPELSKPPTAALAILNFFSNQPDFPAMVGDMNEEFHERVKISGAGAACVWYWKDTFRNAWALTAREIMRTPIRTIIIALGCVLAVNALTVAYVLYALPLSYARQWWILLLLQLVTPVFLGWIGGRLIPGRELALALTYTVVSVCYAGVGIVVIGLWISPVSSIHLAEPLRLLAIWGNGFRQGGFWLGCVAARSLPGGRWIAANPAKQIVGICVFTLVGSSALLSQTAAAPAKWIGIWALNVPESTLGATLMPRAPVGLTLVSQTLRIEQTAREIELSGDTVYSDSTGSHSAHDDNSLSLDGRATVVGPISLSFRRIDDFTFDIISKASIAGRSIGEVSHYSISADGKTLTETKTQTESEHVQGGVDQAADAVTRTSTSVLVFSKVPEQ